MWDTLRFRLCFLYPNCFVPFECPQSARPPISCQLNIKAPSCSICLAPARFTVMRIPDLNERGTIETMRLGIGGWLAGWSKDSLSWVSRLFAKVTNVHNNSLMHELSTDPFWPHLFGEIFVGENVVKFVLLFLLQRKRRRRRRRQSILGRVEFMSSEECKQRHQEGRGEGPQGTDLKHPHTLIIIYKIVSANLHAVSVFDFNLRNHSVFIQLINQLGNSVEGHLYLKQKSV